MGEVDAQRADLIAAQVVNNRVRNPHVAADRRDSGELARVSAGEARLDRGLAGIGQQVIQLWPRVERGLVYVPDQLPGGLAALVLPLTLRRWRFPSPVYPRVSSPRHRPGQCRWRCGSEQGRGARKEMPSSPRRRRVLMVTF